MEQRSPGTPVFHLESFCTVPWNNSQHWEWLLQKVLLQWMRTSKSAKYSVSDVKILKIWTPQKSAIITLKFEHGGFTID